MAQRAGENEFQMLVTLVRAGLTWTEALRMDPLDACAFIEVYNEQERASAAQ